MVNPNNEQKDNSAQALTIGNIPNEPQIWNAIQRIVRTISRAISVIAVVALIALVIIICIDVIGGKFFDSPFPGFTGVLGIAQLLAISFAMGLTFFAGHHIKVELVLNRFPQRTQAVVNALTNLLGFILFVLIVWRMIALAVSFQESGQVLDTVYIPLYPFVYATALAFIPVCLGLLVDFVKSLNTVIRKSSNPKIGPQSLSD
jgi:TRAP-type transport system small permease protein